MSDRNAEIEASEQLRKHIRAALETITDSEVLAIANEEVWHYGNRLVDEILARRSCPRCRENAKPGRKSVNRTGAVALGYLTTQSQEQRC